MLRTQPFLTTFAAMNSLPDPAANPRRKASAKPAGDAWAAPREVVGENPPNDSGERTWSPQLLDSAAGHEISQPMRVEKARPNQPRRRRRFTGKGAGSLISQRPAQGQVGLAAVSRAEAGQSGLGAVVGLPGLPPGGMDPLGQATESGGGRGAWSGRTADEPTGFAVGAEVATA